MGKKRIVKQKGRTMDKNLRSRVLSKVPKKKVAIAILHVQSTYNNTKALVTDQKGNAIMFSSAGALGFKGAKKGTPYAAAKVGEVLGEKAELMGIKELEVVVKGVGSGRESVIRGFTSKSNIELKRIQDKTPVPFNGPRPKKARRV